MGVSNHRTERECSRCGRAAPTERKTNDLIQFPLRFPRSGGPHPYAAAKRLELLIKGGLFEPCADLRFEGVECGKGNKAFYAVVREGEQPCR